MAVRLRAKFWLESEAGGFLLGPGTLRLLLAVAERGSLKAGAQSVGLSYRSAWERLRRAEAGLGFPLLERRSGGAGGGGSSLTPEALELVQRYRGFLQRVEGALQASFAEAFAGWSLQNVKKK